MTVKHLCMRICEFIEMLLTAASAVACGYSAVTMEFKGISLIICIAATIWCAVIAVVFAIRWFKGEGIER